VDDDNDILAVLKRGLEQNNYQVNDFDNPIKALEYLKSVNSPQLLITDIRMPAMTGFELARQVHKDHPDMKIIVLTSFEIDKSEFDKVFPSTTIDAIIKKPVSIKKLVDAVNAVVVGNR
jgi:CheY-like chemotaxis protein